MTQNMHPLSLPLTTVHRNVSPDSYKFRFENLKPCLYLFQGREDSYMMPFINSIWNSFWPSYHFLWPLCTATWALIRKFRFGNLKSCSYLFQVQIKTGSQLKQFKKVRCLNNRKMSSIFCDLQCSLKNVWWKFAFVC